MSDTSRNPTIPARLAATIAGLIAAAVLLIAVVLVAVVIIAAPTPAAASQTVVGPLEINTTVSCLAGNGRVDVNLVNRSDAQITVGLELGALSLRQRDMPGGSWWRMPYTGRPDGSIDLTVIADGAVVHTEMMMVSCDDAVPVLDEPEVRPVSGCSPNNLGYILFQFANATDQSKGYVIEFEGVPNRSTTAAAYGQAVRAVTGRFDGIYDYTVTSANEYVSTGSVAVRCEHIDTAFYAELDPNDNDVAPEIQDLITGLAAEGGGTLWIPAHPQGEPWITSEITLDSNIAIRGMPGAALRFATPAERGAIFRITNKQNVTISGLHLDVGFTGTFDQAGNNYGIVTYESTELEISHNEISNADHGGVSLFASDDSLIAHNHIINNGHHQAGASLWLYASSDNDVSNNKILSNKGGTGVIIDDRSTEEPCRSPGEQNCDAFAGEASENQIHDNRIEIRSIDNTQRSIATGVAVESGFGNVIRDNHIVAHWVGLQVQTGTLGVVVDDLWGPTESTQMIDNVVCGEGVGIVGAQAEKGAISTTIIGGRIDGYTFPLRFLPSIDPAGTDVGGTDMIISNAERAVVAPAGVLADSLVVVPDESDPGPCLSSPPAVMGQRGTSRR